MIEWPTEEKEPTKYWLSTVPAHSPLRKLVRVAKHRWIIERDYEELKQELGPDHYEGRSWRGFHHHATLCIAAYGFLVAEWSRFPPLVASVDWIYPSPKCRASSTLGARPVRVQRHNPRSIATLQQMIARFLLR